MPCCSGCRKNKCTCYGPANCIIRIRSLYRGGFEFKIGTDTTGQQCINHALRSMTIPEDGACYFGLQYDLFGEKCWINNQKSIFTQLVESDFPKSNIEEKRIFTILLRIRFFGIPEILLDHDVFRNFLYHQLKNDFVEGKLTRRVPEMVSLAAYLLHVNSLTLLSHALPGIGFEQKLAAVLPKQVLSVKCLVPYVQLALKVISSLTIEQAKMRFIYQSQLLPHYGIEKFAALVTLGCAPHLVCFSCSGVIIERSRVSSKSVTMWNNVAGVTVEKELLKIEFHPRLKKRSVFLTFPSPDAARRASESALAQKNMGLKWKTPDLQFQPLVHVPRSLLQFDGESSMLSAAIKNIFAQSSDNVYHARSTANLMSGNVRDQRLMASANNVPGLPFSSDANIYGRFTPGIISPEIDAFSLRSSEESTLPLLYGSVLAQSTPVLRPQPATRGISKPLCTSTVTLPHKKRLATSRPFINSPTIMEQSGCGFFSSQQSITHSEWTMATISRPQLAFSHPHLTRRVSDMDQIVNTEHEAAANRAENPTLHTMAGSDRCSSLVFPRCMSSELSSNDPFQEAHHATKFMSECTLDKKSALCSKTPDSNICALAESADDLTALPANANFQQGVRTLPATFKRRANPSSRAICLELIQKLHNRHDLELEFKALPLLVSNEGQTCTIDHGLPARFSVSPSVTKADFASETFWTNLNSNILVVLDAEFLIEPGASNPHRLPADGVISLLQAEAGESVAIGKELFLSLFSITRSASCHTYGIHLKFAASSPHHFNSKTIWLFCWMGQFTPQCASTFGSFVDGIVAADLNTAADTGLVTGVRVASASGAMHLCSLFVVAHVLLRTFRQPSGRLAPSVRSIFDIVYTIRRVLPCTVISMDQYVFLYELLLRWLEKPPRLI